MFVVPPAGRYSWNLRQPHIGRTCALPDFEQNAEFCSNLQDSGRVQVIVLPEVSRIRQSKVDTSTRYQKVERFVAKTLGLVFSQF